jgi:hypothetical protein
MYMVRRAVLAALVPVLLFAAVPEAAAERYLVVFKRESIRDADAARLIAAHGGQVMRSHGDLGVVVATSEEPGFAAKLGKSPEVELVKVDAVVDVHPGQDDEAVVALPPDVRAGAIARAAALRVARAAPVERSNFQPPFIDPALLTQTFLFPLQWDVQKIQLPDAWAEGYAGDPRIKVAVISSGVDYLHADMVGRVDLALSKNFVPEDAAMVQQLFPGKHEILDLGLHGTYTASLISCNAFVTSCDTPNVDLIALKWLNFQEQGRVGDLVAAIDYARQIGAHIIAIPDTLGLFDVELDPRIPAERADIIAMRRAILRAELHGAIVFTGAWTRRDECGFDADHNGPLVHFPGQMGGITVGGTGLDDQWSAETSYGYTLVDLAAPAGQLDTVTCTAPPDLYIFAVGACSGFTQHVTPRNNFPAICNQETTPLWIFSWGVRQAMAHAVSTTVVLYQRYGVHRSPLFIRYKLFTTLDDVIEPGFDKWSGWGRVNAGRAATE